MSFDVTPDICSLYGKPLHNESEIRDQKLPFWQSKTGKTPEKSVLESAQFGLTSIMRARFRLETPFWDRSLDQRHLHAALQDAFETRSEFVDAILRTAGDNLLRGERVAGIAGGVAALGDVLQKAHRLRAERTRRTEQVAERNRVNASRCAR